MQFYLSRVTTCNRCGTPFGDLMYDCRAGGPGAPWGNFCEECWTAFGRPLGVGAGQEYIRQCPGNVPNKTWLLNRGM